MCVRNPLKIAFSILKASLMQTNPYDEHEMMQADTEKRLVRKIDTRLLPFVTVLYFFAIISRISISNIHELLVTDVGLSEIQYSWLATVYFFGYTLLEVPSNLGLKILTPRRWLALMAVSWGATCCLTAFAPNFTWWMVLRGLLGCVSAGVFPGILYYLRFWYLRREMGFRFSIFFSAALLAGGFTGLLSYGVLRMDGVLGLKGWQWLLLFEGVPGVLMGFLTWFILPNTPEDASFLSDTQKDLAEWRLKEKQADENVYDEDEEMSVTSSIELAPLEKHTLSVTLEAFKNPTLWLFSLAYFTISIPLAALNFFLPDIVTQLGFNTLTANLVTGPIYLIAALTTILISKSSDKRMERPFHIVLPCLLSMTGFIGLACFTPQSGLLAGVTTGSSSVAVPLVFAVIAVIGSTPTIPLSCTWLSTLIPKEQPTLLAIGTAMMISFGQIAGILAPMLYPFMNRVTIADSAPEGSKNYSYAHLTVAGTQLISILCIMTLKGRVSHKSIHDTAPIQNSERQSLLP